MTPGTPYVVCFETLKENGGRPKKSTGNLKGTTGGIPGEIEDTRSESGTNQGKICMESTTKTSAAVSLTNSGSDAEDSTGSTGFFPGLVTKDVFS